MTTYTPGPWQMADKRTKLSGYGAIDLYSIQAFQPGHGDFSIAAVWNIDDRAQANAKLIAAAPELVECLRELLAVCREELDPNRTPEMGKASTLLQRIEE